MCLRSDCTEPIHCHFGLSYASYLVLQRSGLQAMPADWQRQLVALLEDYEKTVDVSAMLPPRFTVHARDERGRFVSDPFAQYRHGPKVPMRKADDGP